MKINITKTELKYLIDFLTWGLEQDTSMLDVSEIYNIRQTLLDKFLSINPTITHIS